MSYASKAALTQALRANDHEGVADSIVALIDAGLSELAKSRPESAESPLLKE
jgi:hypothetical protein